MKKIFNILFYVLKFILLIAAFGLTLFIFVRMNIRLEKNMVTAIPHFIPFILILVAFIINLIFRQEGVTKNLFYNLTCCLVFSTIIWACCRAIFDTNMVLNEKYGYGIDFNFFDNFVPYIKIMVYGLVVANVFFMFKERDKKGIKSKKLKEA